MINSVQPAEQRHGLESCYICLVQKGELTGVLHAGMLAQRAGDVFRASIALCTETQTEISRERAAGNGASWQEFNVERDRGEGWDLTSLQKEQKACELIWSHFKIA